MQRIGVLTGGGDAPGLNAVIRAVVKTAVNQFSCQVFGILDGYDGFVNENGVIPLGIEEVRGILPLGGTILGAASRGNPYARKVIRDGKEITIDVSNEIIRDQKTEFGCFTRTRRRWDTSDRTRIVSKRCTGDRCAQNN